MITILSKTMMRLILFYCKLCNQFHCLTHGGTLPHYNDIAKEKIKHIIYNFLLSMDPLSNLPQVNKNPLIRFALNESLVCA